MDDDNYVPFNPYAIDWRIGHEGRRWEKEEVRQRYDLAVNKVELIESKLFWTEEERLTMLGLLLENCGMDAAVRFGDTQAWQEALNRRIASETSP